MGQIGGRRGTGRLAMAVAGLVLAVACGGKSATLATTTSKAPAPTTTSTTVAPPGYTFFTDATDHFKIATPIGWRQVDLTSPGATQAIQQLAKANPKLAPLLGSGDLVSKGVKFLAVDIAAAKFTAGIDVAIKPAVGLVDSDLPQAGDALKAQFQQVGGVVTSITTVPVAGHQGLQIKLQLPITTTTGTKASIDENLDVIAANDLIYIVTFAGSSPLFSTIEQTISVT